MIRDIFTRVTQDDPVKGDWCISGQEVTVWVDASSLATSVVMESNGVAEDVSLLQLVHEDNHINWTAAIPDFDRLWPQLFCHLEALALPRLC